MCFFSEPFVQTQFLSNQRLCSLTSPPDKNTWSLKCSGEINESIGIFVNLIQSLLSRLTLPHDHWPFIQLELFPLSSCAQNLNHFSVCLRLSKRGYESFAHVTGDLDSAPIINECIRKIINSKVSNFNHVLTHRTKNISLLIKGMIMVHFNSFP